MNPDWDGVMKARARESKPAGTVRVVPRAERAVFHRHVAACEDCLAVFTNGNPASWMCPTGRELATQWLRADWAAR